MLVNAQVRKLFACEGDEDRGEWHEGRYNYATIERINIGYKYFYINYWKSCCTYNR